MSEKVYAVFISTLQSGKIPEPSLTLVGVCTDTKEVQKIKENLDEKQAKITEANFYTVECELNELIAAKLI